MGLRTNYETAINVGLNYLDDLSARIRAHVPDADLPEEDTHDLFRIYAVLLLAKGEDVTTEDVHNAWAAWMARLNPTHEALVPYSELELVIAKDDEPYAKAIRLAAREL